MKGLDNTLIAALMSGKPAKKREPNYSKGFAMIRTESGLDKVPITPEIRAAIGKFEGKQGSIRRSKKGRTSIRPNGRRYYVPSYSEVEVVGYKL